MIIMNDWNEALYRDIARKSGSQQAIDDVKYARRIFYYKKFKNIHLRYEEEAMILARMSPVSVRIICVAVSQDIQGGGTAEAYCGLWKILRKRIIVHVFTQ